VSPGTIEPQRAAVVRGRVLTREGEPLSGVKITIKDRPELGQTLSRADGAFDLAVNGGGLLTIDYSRNGYLPSQRKVSVPWQEFVHAPEVALIPLDDNVTVIDLASLSDVVVASGSVIDDGDGRRHARALFEPGTSAEMVLADGSRVPLDTLSVRATEYTVGANGPAAMPGELPGNVAYTYAVELSADEALANGATRVEFDKPVALYVENFLQFPVGSAVPMGYYDREKAAWVPSDNGRVIEVLDVTNGLADVDIDGSGTANTAEELAALGIDDAERQRLAEIYDPGTALWRVEVDHFTPWDCNWPYGPPDDAEPPPVLNFPEDDENLECVSEADGSIIECQRQVLGQRIGIAGTPFTLNYRSSRTEGRLTGRTLDIRLSGASVPDSLRRIELKIDIAGRDIRSVYLPAANLKHTFTWDGRDAYGREVQGRQQATVEVAYVYGAVYLEPAEFERSFARVTSTGAAVAGERGALEIRLTRTSRKQLGNWDARKAGLGGWTISVQHAYDPVGRLLQLGDGGVREGGAPRLETAEGGLNYPHAVAVAPDGTLYIADTNSHRIRRVLPNGEDDTIAGLGSSGFSGDGGPATSAHLWSPSGIALDGQGGYYIADFNNHRIRHVDSAGIIRTVAGVSGAGFSGDGDPAVEAHLNAPRDVVLAPDGGLYIADTNNQRVRHVTPDGIIQTIAGSNGFGFSGDGGSATAAQLNFPGGVAVAPDGSVYIADMNNSRIRRVSADGIITTIAGIGNYGGLDGDGGPATEAVVDTPTRLVFGPDGSLYISQADGGDSVGAVRRLWPDGIITTIAGLGDMILGYTYGIALGPEGDVYVANSSWGQIKRIVQPLSRFSGANILLASQDGREVYDFSPSGLHLRTLDAMTGAVRYAFWYDAAGRLSGIADAFGNETVIERDAAGIPLATIAPHGQRTELLVSTSGYLERITGPDGRHVAAEYDAGGLLTRFVDSAGGESVYAYEARGLLVSAQNPVGDIQTFARTVMANGFEVSRTSPTGLETRYRVERLGSDARRVTTFAPSGASASVELRPDGSQIIERPDGTLIRNVPRPDPRFEMQTAFPSLTVTTPAGLVHELRIDRDADLVVDGDPFSIETLEETITFDGRVYQSVYDGATRTFTLTSPSNRQATAVLDDRGRVVSGQQGMLITAYEYDEQGRLAALTHGSGEDARALTITYGDNGRVATITDPLGRLQQFGYDANGRTVSRTLADGRIVGFEYDEKGHTRSVVPPGRSPYTFAWTPNGNLASFSVPAVGDEESATSFVYDADRALTQVQRPDGASVDYVYDSSGRADSIDLSTGEQHLYTYDSADRITSISAPDVTLSYTWDGFLLTGIDWSGAVPGGVTRSYDESLRVMSIGVNGSAISYLYDSDDLVTGAGDLVIDRALDTGFPSGTTLDGIIETFGRNAFGEVTSYTASHGGTAFYEATHQRDALGRVTSRTETLGGVATTWAFAYDDVDRLVSVEKDSVLAESYVYDDNGNRTSGPAGESYTYDAQDRLVEMTAAGPITTYTYTPNGEPATRARGADVTTYTHDALGRLTHVQLPDATEIEYVLDGRGRRVGKRVDGVLVAGWLYADGLRPVAELDGTGNVVSRFVYASDGSLPAYMVRDGATYRFVADHVGSPRLVVDAATGDVVQRLDYDAFGRITLDTNPGFQPFAFAGGLYDGDTGLVRFGHRDYDAEVGRWTSRDPLAFGGGQLNLYAYAANDPVNNVDRTGLAPKGADQSFFDFAESINGYWDTAKKWFGYGEDAVKVADNIDAINNELDQTGKPLGEQGKDAIDNFFELCKIAFKYLPDGAPMAGFVKDFYGKMFGAAEQSLDSGAESIKNYFEAVDELSGFTPAQPAPESQPYIPDGPSGVNPAIEDLINQQFPTL
jgi:RHS repeat-associated protein